MKNRAFISLIVYSIIQIFILQSCRKDIELPDPELNKLFGTWEWSNSYISFIGEINPKSEGYTEEIEIDKSGIYKEYRNGKKQVTGNFSVVYEKSGFSNTKVYKFRITSRKEHVHNGGRLGGDLRLDFYGDDSLYFVMEVIDGNTHLYIRK